jgi:DNA repair exonuclease SbcCD ATPase subunit
MALEIKTPKLIIKKLQLTGYRKTYEVLFKKGINVIYGDTDTGKSSILNLIDYCLGASTVYLYDEIETSGKYCVLEIELLGESFSIKRDIFNSKKEIEVYPCIIDDLENHFPKYYSCNYSNKVAKDGVFSEFLLSSMNIPITKVKQAPSKADSKFITVSFRDISRFLFLNQDMVGNKKILGDNFPYITKLKETFKLMFNVLDVQISELENLISTHTLNRNDLNKKNSQVSIFLRETQIDSLAKLDLKRQDIAEEIKVIEIQLSEIDKELISNSSTSDKLRASIYISEKKIRKLNQSKITRNQEIKQNIALRNEYEKDIDKTLAAIEFFNKSPIIEESKTNCPVCEQEIKVSELRTHFEFTDTKVLKGEINSFRRRKKALQNLIEKLRTEAFDQEKEELGILEELKNFKQTFDIETKNIVSPYINQRDSLVSRKGNLESDRKNIKHFYKIRMQQKSIEGDIKSLEDKIGLLNEDLKKLKESAPSLDSILNQLGDTLKEFLDFIGMKNVFGVSASKKSFLPIIRNRDYEKVTSGGIRTLSSVGYYLSLLEFAISNSVNYPSFLMIDTIAKYIGKTKKEYDKLTNKEEDKDEGMNDSDKYKNIYMYLLKLQKKFNNFQVIVVDNDIPDELRSELKPFIRKYFSTNGDGVKIKKGFIDDI